ncbi:MFS transporter [Streptomyces mirabilis]|uniref:MFS transporter n=1 Tax=Streptomyces mirabilis TaxID=68239 RepID=UPI0036D94C65
MGDIARVLKERLLRERERPQWVRRSRFSWQLAVLTVCVGGFMGQLDASIVTLIYPSLQREFGEPLATVEWVSLAYLLVLTALLVTVSHLSDLLGRKLIYLYGFALFTLSSAACSLSPNLTVLVICRVVQALGAAMAAGNSIGLVTIAAPREKLRGALGFQTSGQALGLAAGPTLGGLLVTTVGWRWVFWINVPIGIVAVLSGRYLLPRTVERTVEARFDLRGTAWLTAAVTTVLGGLSILSGLPVPGWAGAVVLTLSALAFGAFWRHEKHARAPLVPPSLLRDRRISRGLVGAMTGYLVLFGPLVLVPLVETRNGGSELRAGLLLTALPVGFAVSSSLQEKLLPHGWTSHRRCVAGVALSLAGLVGLAFAAPVDWWLIFWLTVLALGLGLFTPSNNEMVMALVPRKLSSTGGGILNTFRMFGMPLGIALVTLGYELAGDRTWNSVLPLVPVLMLTAVAALMWTPMVLKD